MKPGKTIHICVFFLIAGLLLNGCKKDKKSDPVPTTPPISSPAYDFSFPGQKYYIGDSVRFSSTAPAGTPLLWNFGDGDTSTDFTPVHVYYSYGQHYITLMANNDNNQVVRKSIDIDQYAIQYAYDLPFYPGKSISFTSTVPPGSTYLWNFGDSTTSTEASPAHSYTHGGMFKVSLVFNNTPSKILYDSVYISLYPSKSNLIAGSKSWHHNYYGYFANGSTMIYNTYADTSFTINRIDDFTLSVGSETLKYNRSDDSSFYYTGNYTISYNVITGSTKFYKQILYTGVGHNLWYYVDNFYTP